MSRQTNQCRRLLVVALIGTALLNSTLAEPASAAEVAQADHSLVAEPLTAKQLAETGLRQIVGERLILVTDLPPGKGDIEALPALLAEAYAQWCDYFNLPELRQRPWRVKAFLMVDRQRFVRLGLLPPEVPPFLHGYAMGLTLWMNEQPSEYYRRHLLLHEAAHAFFLSLLDVDAPPWYAEGMAELLATHRLEPGTATPPRLKVNTFPASRDETPDLGRIKLLRQAVAAGQVLSVDEVMQFGPRAHLVNEAYAYSWALAKLLDTHPRFQERFRRLAHCEERVAPEGLSPGEARRMIPGEPPLNRRLRVALADDWPLLEQEWQLLLHHLDYGYDIARAATVTSPAEPAGLAAQPNPAAVPLPPAGQEVPVAADRFWQSSGIWVEAGQTYRLRAEGRYSVAQEPRPWWCEPQGVSVEYVDGRPLGELLAAVVPSPLPVRPAASPLLKPQPIGREALLQPERSGMLYLRINELPGGLGDNAGTLSVRITAED